MGFFPLLRRVGADPLKEIAIRLVFNSLENVQCCHQGTGGGIKQGGKGFLGNDDGY